MSQIPKHLQTKRKNPSKKSLRDFALPVAFSAACTVTAVPANADNDLFVDIPGTTGASLDTDFKGQTDVLSWSWGVYRPYTPGVGGGGGSSSTPGFGEVTLDKAVDSATVGIQTLVLSGNSSTITMSARAPSGSLAYQVELQDARITSSQIDDAEGLPNASEVVTIAYDRYCYTPFIQDTKGGVTQGTPVCWDLLKNDFF